ncbi:MAG: ATP-binding cassette domain-containing protein, partial [Anaerolineales bacterium]
MVVVKKLVKRFGQKTVLRGVNLTVQNGEFVAILGPNGAGKTTLLRILATLSRPSTGIVEIAGYNLSSHPISIRQLLGVVTHAPLLYGDLS